MKKTTMIHCSIFTHQLLIFNFLGENLKQKARSLFVPPSHPYLAGQLLRSGLSLHCPGNFKLAYLNISCNYLYNFNI